MDNLTLWLLKNRMSLKQFCEKIGCSRQTIYLSKKGRGISKEFALKIIEMTAGEVKPLTRNKGRGQVIDI